MQFGRKNVGCLQNVSLDLYIIPHSKIEYVVYKYNEFHFDAAVSTRKSDYVIYLDLVVVSNK